MAKLDELKLEIVAAEIALRDAETFGPYEDVRDARWVLRSLYERRDQASADAERPRT